MKRWLCERNWANLLMVCLGPETGRIELVAELLWEKGGVQLGKEDATGEDVVRSIDGVRSVAWCVVLGAHTWPSSSSPRRGGSEEPSPGFRALGSARKLRLGSKFYIPSWYIYARRSKAVTPFLFPLSNPFLFYCAESPEFQLLWVFSKESSRKISLSPTAFLFLPVSNLFVKISLYIFVCVTRYHKLSVVTMER